MSLAVANLDSNSGDNLSLVVADSTPVLTGDKINGFTSTFNVAVLQENGAGGFAGTVLVPVGNLTPLNTLQSPGYGTFTATNLTNPTGVAVADLNGDGLPDLAVSGNNGLAILTNTTGSTSNLSFSAPTMISALPTTSVAIGPVDTSTTNSVFATSDSSGGEVVVFQNEGTNSTGQLVFSSPSSVSVGASPRDLQLKQVSPVNVTASITSVSGTAGTPIVITTASTSQLSTGQLVSITGVTGYLTAIGSFTITVVDSTHFSLNGTTATGSTVSQTSANWTLFSREILVVNDVAAGTITVLNNITQTAVSGLDTVKFSSPIIYSVPVSNPTSLALPNYLTQGIPEVAVASQTGTQITFGPLSSLGSTNANTVTNSIAPQAVAYGHFTGTTYLDLAVAEQDSTGDAFVAIYQGVAGGGYAQTPSLVLPLPAGAKPAQILVADFNTVAISSVGGSLGSPITITSSTSGLVTGGTVTISGVTGYSTANGTFVVTVIDPTHFSLNGTTATGAVSTPTSASWNNNLDDIIVANSGLTSSTGNSVSIFVNDTTQVGQASFAPHADYDGGNNPTSLALADLNGGGTLDLVVADGGAEAPDSSGNSYYDIHILTGNGDGTFNSASFAAGTIIHVGTTRSSASGATGLLSPNDVAVGDLGDGNGLPDIVLWVLPGTACPEPACSF